MTLIVTSADGDILISATARATFTIPSEWLAYWFSNASIFDSPQGRNNFFEGSLDEIGITQNCGIPWWYRIGRRWSCHQTNMRSMQLRCKSIKYIEMTNIEIFHHNVKGQAWILCINYKNQILPSPRRDFFRKINHFDPIFPLQLDIKILKFFGRLPAARVGRVGGIP